MTPTSSETSFPHHAPGFYCALALAATIPPIELGITYLALPRITAAFGGDPLVIWIITAHYLVGASSAGLGGRLGDRYGRRQVLLIVLAMCALGSSISTLSTSLWTLVLGRGMQGLSAAVIPLCFGIIRESVPAARVPVIIGVVASVPGVASGVAFLAGGLLLDHFPWRSIFLFTSMLTICALVCVGLFTKCRTKAPIEGALDWMGGLLFVPAVGGFLYAVNQARKLGWDSPAIVGGICACVVIVMLWARHELRHRDPLIDVRMLANRKIALANICMILFALGEMQNVQALMFLLQQAPGTGAGFGLSPGLIGALQIPMLVLNIVGGIFTGRLASAKGSRYTALLSATVLTVAGFAIALFHSSLWPLILLNYLLHLGISMLFAAIPNLIVEAAPMERIGEATGMNSVLRQMSLGIGSQMIGYLLATSTVPVAGPGAGHVPADAAYTLVFLVTATCSLISAVALKCIPRGAEHDAAPPPAAAIARGGPR